MFSKQILLQELTLTVTQVVVNAVTKNVIK